MYLKWIEIWATAISDMEESIQYLVLVESLKINKDIKGLGKYVGEYILPLFDRVETLILTKVN